MFLVYVLLRLSVFLAGLVVLGAGARTAKACEPAPYTHEARYDEVWQNACHNCYEKQYASHLTDALDHVSAIEIDFWDSRFAFFGSRPGHWYVGHRGVGNDNNCVGDGGEHDLRACLIDLKRWSDAHPGHDVVTVFLDKKQGWGGARSGRAPADLDALILDVFARTRVFAPSDLAKGHASPREAAREHGWPLASALANRFLFVITGQSLSGANDLENQYVESRGSDALAFVATDASSEKDIVEPRSLSRTAAEQAVFFNLKASDIEAAPAARREGAVVRVWGGDDRPACGAPRECVNFDALYDDWDRRCLVGKRGIFAQGSTLAQVAAPQH